MSSLAVAFAVFGCCVGSALAGMVLHRKLPRDHLDSDSKDVVKLVMGLIATMAALVLGLLIASAKASYDTQATEMQQLGAQIVQMDRMLVLYGPETREIRDSLRQALIDAHDWIWPSDKAQAGNIDPAISRVQADLFYDKLARLSPKTEAQTRAQNTALELAGGLAHTRILMFEQIGGSVAWPLLTVLVFLGIGAVSGLPDCSHAST